MKGVLILLFSMALLGCDSSGVFSVAENEALYAAVGGGMPNLAQLREGQAGAIEVRGGNWGSLQLYLDDVPVEKIDGGFFLGPILNTERTSARVLRIEGDAKSDVYFGMQLITFNGNSPDVSTVVKLIRFPPGQIKREIPLSTLR